MFQIPALAPASAEFMIYRRSARLSAKYQEIVNASTLRRERWLETRWKSNPEDVPQVIMPVEKDDGPNPPWLVLANVNPLIRKVSEHTRLCVVQPAEIEKVKQAISADDLIPEVDLDLPHVIARHRPWLPDYDERRTELLVVVPGGDTAPAKFPFELHPLSFHTREMLQAARDEFYGPEARKREVVRACDLRPPDILHVEMS